MKKRIGSRYYDTETAELIAENAFGKIYRKRSRGREWFVVWSDPELIDPLDDAQARAMLGESYVEDPEPRFTTIWVDRETHAKIAEMARRDSVTITEEVRRIVETVIK